MQVVAIGTFAGDIEAFRLFFEAMPADSGMGFVVVPHLSADRKSLLAAKAARDAPAQAAASDLQTDTARLSICGILRAQLDHDFSQYKDKTFVRRVQRRM